MLSPGQLIARLELDDPAAVRRAEPFTGSFPELGPPVVESEGVAHRFHSAVEAAENMMAGYHNSPDAGGWGRERARWFGEARREGGKAANVRETVRALNCLRDAAACWTGWHMHACWA